MKLEVIGLTKENNVIVSRDSLEKYQKQVDFDIAFYKHKIRVLQKELQDLKAGSYEK